MVGRSKRWRDNNPCAKIHTIDLSGELAQKVDVALPVKKSSP